MDIEGAKRVLYRFAKCVIFILALIESQSSKPDFRRRENFAVQALKHSDHVLILLKLSAEFVDFAKCNVVAVGILEKN